MIALDTNALIRLLIEDDEKQAEKVQNLVRLAEKKSLQILILPEVLIETVWVLESVYKTTRKDTAFFLETLLTTSPFTVHDMPVIASAVRQYKKSGEFSDMILIGKAKKHHANLFFSFDKKLQNRYPDFVSDKLNVLLKS
jgi:predicted nucleic-acid-binding protein